MKSRFLLAVAALGVLGTGELASAAVVSGGATAVYAFDLPDPATGYFVTGDISVIFGCNSGWPCASPWDYWENPETGDWERISHPPDLIMVLLGTAAGLDDIATMGESGFTYPDNPNMGFSTYPTLFPEGLRTVYATFTIGEEHGDHTFYKVDFARLSFFWGEEYTEEHPIFPDWVPLEGRLYDPFAPVPLPGSLLLILSSLGACTVPAIRRRVRGRA